MSEIQGGSNIPSNRLEAIPEGNHYCLHGTKFFTSVVHADYAVVTAKVSGREEVGAVIVPTWLPGNKAKEIRKGISNFGGHGVIDDFCSLPRVFRDAAVNKLWKGPRNVFLMQVFLDLGRAAAFYPLGRFLGDLLTGVPEADIVELGRRARKFTTDPPFEQLDADSRRRAVEKFRLYQETALKEVGPAPIIGPGKMSLPELWD